MKRLLIIIFLTFPLMLIAQKQKTGNLSIFSEDGDKFILILNGEKQNDIAQSNLRIEELPQPYYNAKIIFSDSTILPLSKNNLLIADPDGIMMDVTYKIKKDKSRKAKLNYFSAIPVQQDYIPASGVSVYHYGNPSMGSATINTTTSTTTTTTSDGVSASINMNGAGLNVVIKDPYLENTSSTTTTTQTSSTSGTHSNANSNTNTKVNCNGWPMNAADFSAALKTISNSSFDESKLTTAKSISAKNCLSTDQVVKICQLFSFEDSKLIFAKHAYKRTTDQNNYFKVNNVFSFESNKEELSNFISDE